MPYLASILLTLFLAVPAMSVELFRYGGAAMDGGTLEYVFDGGEENSPNAVTKEKAAEIAADFMATFITYRSEHWRAQEFRTTPAPFWLICFSDTTKGPMRPMFFVVLLPDGTVVEPSLPCCRLRTPNKSSPDPLKSDDLQAPMRRAIETEGLQRIFPL